MPGGGQGRLKVRATKGSVQVLARARIPLFRYWNT